MAVFAIGCRADYSKRHPSVETGNRTEEAEEAMTTEEAREAAASLRDTAAAIEIIAEIFCKRL
jgi:hypothetical protein